MGHQLRKRATAVVIQDGRVLLVRHRGSHKYSLPGGGVHSSERSYQAAMRELREETGLHPTSAHYIGSYDGASDHHKAFLIEATGRIRLDRREVGDHVWWDRHSNLPINGHVHAILRMLGH